MGISLWGNNKHYLLKNMQKQHLLTTGIACGLSVLVCADLIDDMTDKTADVIDRVSNQLNAGFPVQVADIIFDGVGCRVLGDNFEYSGTTYTHSFKLSPKPQPATQTQSSPAPVVCDCPAHSCATDHKAPSLHQSVA